MPDYNLGYIEDESIDVHVSDDLLEMAKIAKKDKEYIIKIMPNVISILKEKITDVEVLLEQGYDIVYINCFESLMHEHWKMLPQYGIYDIGWKQYCHYCMVEMESDYPFVDYLHSVNEEYSKINEDADEKIADRELNKALRARVIGGGFGFSGAVKGIATAGMLNLASGWGYDIFNAIGNTLSESKREAAKEELFQETFPGLIDAIIKTFSSLYLAFCSAADINCKGELNEEHSKILIENMKEGIIPGYKIPELLKQAFEENPMNADAYFYFLEHYGISDELLKMARDLGMFSVLAKYYKKIVEDLNVRAVQSKYSKEVIDGYKTSKFLIDKFNLNMYGSKSWEELKNLVLIDGVLIDDVNLFTKIHNDLNSVKNIDNNVDEEWCRERIQKLLDSAKDMHGGVLKQYAYAINKIANKIPEFKNMSNPPQLDLLLRYQEEYMADPNLKKDPSYPYYKLLQKYKLAFDDTFSSNYNEDIFNVVSALVEGKDSLSFPKYSMLSERLVNPSYKGNVKDRALEILTVLYLLYDVIKGIDDDKVLVGIDKVAEFIKSIPKDLNKKLDALITTVAIEFGEEQWDMMAVIAKRKAGFKDEGLIYLDKERTRNVVKELVAKPAFKQYANILNQYLDDYDVLAEYTRLKQTLPSNINHMSMEECKTFADAADNIVVRCTHDDIRKKMLVDIKIYRDAYLREKMPYIFSITELLSKILVNKRQEEEAKQKAVAEEEARQRAIADEEAQMRGEENDAETEDNSTEEELVQSDTEIPIDDKVVQKEPVPSVTAKQLTGRELFLSKYGDAAETFESKKGTSMFKGLFKIVMGGFIVPTIICGMIPPIALAWPALIIYYFWRLHKKNKKNREMLEFCKANMPNEYWDNVSPFFMSTSWI